MPRSRPIDDQSFEPLEARRVLAAFATPGEPLAVSLSETDQFVIAARDTDGYFRTFESIGDGLEGVDDLTDNINDLIDDIFGDPAPQPAVLAEPADGPWLTRAEDDAEPQFRPLTPVTSFTSPFDGDSYAAGASASGVVIYSRSDDGGGWDQLLVTTSDDGIITSNLVSAVISGAMYVAGTNADGDVILYENTGGDWVQRNLSDEFFSGQGPGWEGRLIAFETSWDAVNLAGLNSDGEIVTVWTAPGLGSWAENNLSETAGAPALVGGLSEYTTPWSGVNITGVTANGDLNVVWWVPQFGGDWVVTDFNEELGGPQLLADSITAYVTPWNGLNIAGLDATGKLWTFWWVPEFASDPANDFWRVEDLSDDFNSSERTPMGPLTAEVSDDGVISIFGVEEDAEVVQIYWTADDGWRSENISEVAIEV